MSSKLQFPSTHHQTAMGTAYALDGDSSRHSGGMPPQRRQPMSDKTVKLALAEMGCGETECNNVEHALDN